MAWRWAVIVLGLGLLAGVASARPGVVVTREGQTYEGDVRQEGDELVIEMGSITVRVGLSRVTSVQMHASPQQEFESRMRGLAPGDAAARMALARWAFERRMYHEARTAAEAVFEVDPNSAQAAEFVRAVDRQMRMERAQGATRPAAVPVPPKVPDPPEPAAGTTDADTDGKADGLIPRPARPKLISAAEVNRIRQLEWQAGDSSVRVRVPDDVRRQFAREQGYDPARFAARPILDQAYEIIRNGTREQADRVTLLNDPRSIAVFRRQIQPRLLAGCASAGCHGANPGGEFTLISPADRDVVVYTNFHTLLTSTVNGPDGLVLRMIDRALPDQSLLLQYGLPRGAAQTPHPQVRGFRAVYGSTRDAAYVATTDWITRMLSPVEPDYSGDRPKVNPIAPFNPRPTAPADAGPAPDRPVAPGFFPEADTDKMAPAARP